MTQMGQRSTAELLAQRDKHFNTSVHFAVASIIWLLIVLLGTAGALLMGAFAWQVLLAALLFELTLVLLTLLGCASVYGLSRSLKQRGIPL